MKDKNRHRLLSDTYANHIHVLRAMCLERLAANDKSSFSEKVVQSKGNAAREGLSREVVYSARSLEISEIAERSGLDDEKEVLRSLYILEGAKFVSPNPVGDFTSKIWRITDDGVRAFQTITAELAQAN